jgi:pimeloyl-ACP methyl ester carboxylesterase
VIGALELEWASVLGWSLGGFIAQALAVRHPSRINKLILLSTDLGGADAKVASPAVRSRLTDMSGTPHEQARRLLSLLFPGDVAESIYREFGDVVATARAKLSHDIVHRQAAAMDAWHSDGLGDRLRELSVPVLATGTEDIVIPASNALALVNAIPSAWLAQFKGGGHAFMAQYPRPLAELINEFLAL